MTPYTLPRNAQLPVNHRLNPRSTAWCSANAAVPSIALAASVGARADERFVTAWCATRMRGARRSAGWSERCAARERWNAARTSEPVRGRHESARGSLSCKEGRARRETHRRGPS